MAGIWLLQYVIGRAGASPPSPTTGMNFLYIDVLPVRYRFFCTYFFLGVISVILSSILCTRTPYAGRPCKIFRTSVPHRLHDPVSLLAAVSGLSSCTDGRLLLHIRPRDRESVLNKERRDWRGATLWTGTPRR